MTTASQDVQHFTGASVTVNGGFAEQFPAVAKALGIENDRIVSLDLRMHFAVDELVTIDVELSKYADDGTIRKLVLIAGELIEKE